MGRSKIITATLAIAVFTACAPAQFTAIPKEEGGLKIDPETPVLKATESFTQDDAANKVDILIINDNSSSMDDEQRKMSERFGSFISSISDIDYRIATTTTDVNSSSKYFLGGKILTWEGSTSKVLTPLMSNASDLFKETIVRKETIGCYDKPTGWDCPSTNEEPLKALMLSIDQRNSANAGFMRDGVDLVVVVLSDEDEMSDGLSPNATTANQVMNHFLSSFGGSKRLMVHGIVIQPGDTVCRAAQNLQTHSGNAAFYGQRVVDLAAATGGTTASICDTDYARSLSTISQQVRKLVGTFELGNAPVAGSVKVTLTPAAPNVSFKIEGSKLIFSTPPPAGTKIEIAYDYQ